MYLGSTSDPSILVAYNAMKYNLAALFCITCWCCIASFFNEVTCWLIQALSLNLFLHYSACCDLWHTILNNVLLASSFLYVWKACIKQTRLYTLVPSLLGFKAPRASILEVSPPPKIIEFNAWQWIEWSWAPGFPIRKPFSLQRQIHILNHPRWRASEGISSQSFTLSLLWAFVCWTYEEWHNVVDIWKWNTQADLLG